MACLTADYGLPDWPMPLVRFSVRCKRKPREALAEPRPGVTLAEPGGQPRSRNPQPQGEAPGALDSALRVTLAGSPLLHDAIRISSASSRDDIHVVLGPGQRVATSVSLLGMRPDPAPRTLALQGPGALRRATGTSLAHVDAAVDEIWGAWSRRGAKGHARPISHC